MRAFKANGREYSDTPAGWLAASKDEWAASLRSGGHSMSWSGKVGARYEGSCRDCGGWITVMASSSSTNMRSLLGGRRARRCRGRT